MGRSGSQHSSANQESGKAAEQASQEMLASLPQISLLQNAVRVASRRVPSGKTIRHDGIAGLTTAISNVPDGLANGVLVGVNPLFGLYAAMVGPFTGGLLASTQRMVVTTTAAASMTAAEAISRFQGEQRESALFMLAVMAGGFMLLAGALRLGRLLRFVSYSVTTGFLLGVSVLLILSQLPTIAGYNAAGDNRVAQVIDLFTHLGRVSPWAIGLAALTMGLAIGLRRTPLRKFANIAAILVPSGVLAVVGIGNVAVVQDIGEIPDAIPRPHWPQLSQALELATGAVAVAVVTMVQGAGVSQSVSNPKGAPRKSTSRDFFAQGAANVASGLFRGLPVGGSLSATALGLLSGAQSRWTPIFAGLTMALILLVLPGPVSHIAMPSLGALLILAGLNSIKPGNLRSVWEGGWHSRVAAGTTFAATLFLPIQAAVGIGVALAALLHTYESSLDIAVVELKEEEGATREYKAPERLPSGRVTVLDVYGSLSYAGARTFEQLLPSPAGARHPAVVLRLHGRSHHDATLTDVFDRYANDLATVDGRLYLSGVSQKALTSVDPKLLKNRAVKFYPATTTLGEATRAAEADARRWLSSLQDGG